MRAAREDRHRGHQTSSEGLRRRLLAGLPVTERRIELAGIPTAVLVGGQGPPIVLLHGPGEFAGVWIRVIPELANSHRVVAPDLPGHGASGVGRRGLGRPEVLAWLGELIERTCQQPPTIGGHLLGGAIAARFAAARSEKLERLVLVDSHGLAWLRPTIGFTLSMFGFLARPNERTQDRLFRQCMADLDGLRDRMGERMRLLEAYALERARTPELKSALRRLMPRFGVPAIPGSELERVAVPTTLIWGRHDRQVRLSVAERASERYGWPLHVIEECADDPAVEQPDAFLEAFGSALERPIAASPGGMSREAEG